MGWIRDGRQSHQASPHRTNHARGAHCPSAQAIATLDIECGSKPDDSSVFHGQESVTGNRLLRVIMNLNCAYGLGLGTNRLDEIDVVGLSIDDMSVHFEPCWG
jgi:hypothetical protein